jgi:3D (Asp-Asp-Asp) domain-containing protein
MKPDQRFVSAVFIELFTKNFEQYKESLSKPLNSDNYPYAKARNALATLSDDDRANVFAFFNVIIADSASVVLGTLDGVHFPDGIDGDLVVTCEGEEIQGDLIDIFIEKTQEENVYG